MASLKAATVIEAGNRTVTMSAWPPTSMAFSTVIGSGADRLNAAREQKSEHAAEELTCARRTSRGGRSGFQRLAAGWRRFSARDRLAFERSRFNRPAASDRLRTQCGDRAQAPRDGDDLRDTETADHAEARRRQGDVAQVPVNPSSERAATVIISTLAAAAITSTTRSSPLRRRPRQAERTRNAAAT